ncbi:MAG: SEL1-like repeat protein [Candidatus Krumholzibacteriota bacterium]|nr:SEL1-like repeat protein [Candidatus Krumholzibacteriota bacterium]
MFNLGVMYETGLWVDKNRSEMLKWYKKAAALGNEDATKKLRELGDP